MLVPLKNSAGDHLLQGCIADSHTAFWHSCVRIRANLSTAVSACDIWCFKLLCAVALSATTRLGLPFDPPPQSMRQLSGRRTEKVEGRKENARRELFSRKYEKEESWFFSFPPTIPCSFKVLHNLHFLNFYFELVNKLYDFFVSSFSYSGCTVVQWCIRWKYHATVKYSGIQKSETTLKNLKFKTGNTLKMFLYLNKNKYRDIFSSNVWGKYFLLLFLDHINQM